MDDTYSLRDLVEVTGAKPRSLQLWADRKVIHAIADTDDAGSGVHRRFSREEAIIACIVQAFALRQIPIGELKQIGQTMRHSFSHTRGRDRINDAIHGKGNTYLIYHVAEGKRVVTGYIEDVTRFLKEPDSMALVIRLETYLSKLK
jgi:hypothetical protein